MSTQPQPKPREVGVRGLVRIQFDETELREAKRRVMDGHRVTESYAKWAAGVTARRLIKMDLRELAFEREYLESLAMGPFHVTQDHLGLFVKMVRAETEHAVDRRLREPPPAPRVRRVWKSLEMQRAEQEAQDAAR